MTKKEEAIKLFKEGCDCSRSIIEAFAEELDTQKMAGRESRFGVLPGFPQNMCGVVAASYYILEHYMYKTEHDFEALQKEFCTRFKEKNGSICCCDLTGCSAPELATEDHEKECMNLVGEAVEVLQEMVS